MAITAKAKLTHKSEFGEGDDKQASLWFVADYTDARNEAWSRYTPHLDLRMTVLGSVSDQFHLGNSYTITFEPSDS